MATMLDVSKPLKEPGQVFPFTTEVTIDPMEIFGDTLTFTTVSVKGTMVGARDTVSIAAEAECEVTSCCARCRKPVTIEHSATIEAFYTREPDPEDPDPDQYVFEGYKLDVQSCVHDALVLALPMQFHCSEDCKGLCPQCGEDLNTGACTCQKGDDDSNPFAALRSIVIDNEEV